MAGSNWKAGGYDHLAKRIADYSDLKLRKREVGWVVWTTKKTGGNSRQTKKGSGSGPPPDVVDWVRERLGVKPDALQARVLGLGTKRGILNCSRQWGKSTITAAKAVHQAFTEAGSLTLVVSPSARQTGEFLRKAAGFLRKLKIRPKGDGDNEMSLALPNGSRIVGVPGTEATIRGFSAVRLLLVDEASRVDDDVYMAVRPMLATSDGGLWLMSTPNGKRGFFYETWVNGGPGWERILAPATECARIKTSFLEEERQVMSERCFRQEYLCEFEDAVSSVFQRDMVERALTDGVEPLDL